MMPSDKIEVSILGTALLNESFANILIESTSINMFASKEAKGLFQFLFDCYKSQIPISIPKAKQNVDGSFVELCLKEGSPAAFKSNVSDLRDMFMASETLLILQRAMANVSGNNSPSLAISEVQEQFDALASQMQTGTLKTFSSVHEEALGKALKNRTNQVQYNGFNIGWETFMKKADGVLTGQGLYTIFGKSGSGKTQLMGSIKRNLEAHGHPSATISIEMSAQDLSYREAARHLGVSLFDLKKGNINDEQFQEYQAWVKAQENSKSVVIDDAKIYVEDIWSYVRDLSSKNIKVIFIDYYQILDTHLDFKGNVEGKYTYISKELTAMQKQYDMAFFLLAQMDKIGARNRLPDPNHIRYSSQPYNDSYMMIGVYRPEAEGIQAEGDKPLPPGFVRAIISKHRNGPLFSVDLAPEQGTGKLTEYKDPGLLF